MGEDANPAAEKSGYAPEVARHAHVQGRKYFGKEMVRTSTIDTTELFRRTALTASYCTDLKVALEAAFGEYTNARHQIKDASREVRFHTIVLFCLSNHVNYEYCLPQPWRLRSQPPISQPSTYSILQKKTRYGDDRRPRPASAALYIPPSI